MSYAPSLTTSMMSHPAEGERADCSRHEEDEDAFVPPKPVITTVTKQAEISTTERIVSGTKKVTHTDPSSQRELDNLHTRETETLVLPATTIPLISSASPANSAPPESSSPLTSSSPPASSAPLASSASPASSASLASSASPANLADEGGEEAEKCKRTAVYWPDSDEERASLTRSISDAKPDSAESRAEGTTSDVSSSSENLARKSSTHEQAEQIHGSKPKRMMLTLSSDDNLGVRFILSSNSSGSSKLATMEDTSQHRKLLASRVAQLANEVFGLREEDEVFGAEGEVLSPPCTVEHSGACCELVNSRVIHPCSLADDESSSACDETLLPPDDTSSSQPTNHISISKSPSPLTPVPQASGGRRDQSAGRRERRKEVLTNGSLIKSVRLAAADDASRQLDSQAPGRQRLEQAEPRETILPTDAENPCGEDAVKVAQRPNSLDILSTQELHQQTMISSLIRPTPDVVITPTVTPRSFGLINPGFVFEFPNAVQTLSADDSTGARPIASPSLLDVLHKKHWANSSPSSTLSRKRKDGDEAPDADQKMTTSAFRARHESYCRVVDQNADEDLAFQTLPNPRRTGGEDKAMRMFGDVSQMFNTLPVRSSPEHRHHSPSESAKPGAEIDVGGVQRVSSTGKLANLTVSLLPSTGSSTSTKLSRKFSLSPKVLRRKIIARLQLQEADKAGSSESEADDQLTSLTSRQRPLYKDLLQRENKDKKKLELEIEAVEACSWLSQAGFPQYVQLFEDSQFPIDLQTVEKDHSFLDEQQLQSLFRRLNTLNKSVHMKLDINNKKPIYASGADEDEEEACVLSDKWHFERASGRWSHIDAAPGADSSIARMRSCSSRDSVMTDETTGEETGDSASPVLQSKNFVNNNNHRLKVNVTEQSLSDTSSSTTSPNPKSQQTFEKQFKQRNGNFFQRHVGSLTRRSSNKNMRRDKSGAAPLISGPTLVNTPDMSERMQRLGCIEIQSKTLSDDLFNNNNNTSKSLLRSVSVDNDCSCDNCSVSSTVTEYTLPSDYVLGTFPRELLENQVPSRQNSISSTSRLQHCGRKSSSTPRQKDAEESVDKSMNRRSVYDNLPLDDEVDVPSPASTTTEGRRELDAVLHDLLRNITNLDLDGDANSSDLFNSLLAGASDADAIAADSQHLQIDSAIVSPTSDDLSSLSGTPADTPELKRSAAAELMTSSEELSRSREGIIEEEEAEDEEEEDGIREVQETIWRERRDSGVGSSLTREPLERKKKVRLRWHSFVASHRPSFNSLNQHISSLSAGQLMYLKRLSLLKVTSLMERYSPSHKSGFSLQLVNRFIKKGSRTPDYSEKKIFGVPLSVTLQRTGQPLPQSILHAMRYLRKSAPEADGIFRKSGVRSRIQKLRDDLEQDPDNVVQFDSMQSYDVADMFKLYLRELPECLVTNKLSETFLAIYQHVPQELRLEALQACSLLLPDENREVLESLLYFLSDMASYHEENQMTASNLAMCFAPSLFNIHNRSSQSKSPKSSHKTSAPGIADQKEFQEQRSATDCLTSMIIDCKKVFRIPEDFLSKCSSSSSYMEAGEPAPLSLLGAAPDYEAHIDSCIQGLLKESKDKGWCAVQSLSLALANEESVDVSYKKVHDSNPLRLWKCSIEIEATPADVLNRILNERQKWDEDLLKWRTVEKLDTRLDVFQYVCTSMAPQPSREYLILRAWKVDLPKGACALVMHSIDHEVSSLGGGIRGIVLASHYLIEPCGAKSKLTHISRIDGRGRQAKWYNRSYGSLAANALIRIKESFNGASAMSVHETKV